jgi:hypothetical protein
MLITDMILSPDIHSPPWLICGDGEEYVWNVWWGAGMAINPSHHAGEGERERGNVERLSSHSFNQNTQVKVNYILTFSLVYKYSTHGIYCEVQPVNSLSHCERKRKCFLFMQSLICT